MRRPSGWLACLVASKGSCLKQLARRQDPGLSALVKPAGQHLPSLSALHNFFQNAEYWEVQTRCPASGGLLCILDMICRK